MFSFSKYVFIMPAIMTWTHSHTDIPVHHRKIIKSSFCHYTIKNFIDVFIDFQMISPSGFNGDISSPVAPRWQRHHTAPLVSSGPTLCVYELVCYRGEKLEASIVPAATKPDMKHSPQTPVRFTPPPFTPSNQHGGLGGGKTRGRKTSIRKQRLTGDTTPPILLVHPQQAEHRAPSPALCLALICQLEETHTYIAYMYSSSQRSCMCVCVSRHFM